MQTKPTIEPTGSPAPGVIPEPVRVHRDTAVAHKPQTAPSTASGTTKTGVVARPPEPGEHHARKAAERRPR